MNNRPISRFPSYQYDGKILVTDVDYRDNEALVAGILLQSWSSENFEALTCRVPISSEYEPGAFYKRELPCLLELLKRIEVPLSCIVVDGYAHLGSEQRPGLGQRLHSSLDGTIPVIGVAKTYFKDTPDECRLYRGGSTKALYVTAEGVGLEPAKQSILCMHGPHRMPSALKLADQACRTASSGALP
jgi:deoxyribonuclease V